MFVIKRGWPLPRIVEVCSQRADGRKESVMFDKITYRITKLSYGLNADHVDPVLLAIATEPFSYDRACRLRSPSA